MSMINNVGFDIYTSKEVKDMSSCHITNPVAYNDLGQPNPNGVHDPSMGVSPYDRAGRCVTCSQDETECTGHFGHIELPATIYNPFMLKFILRMLNSKCFNCHRLRIRSRDKKYFYLKFLLTKLGLINEANQFESIIYNSLAKEADSSSINNKLNIFIKSLGFNKQMYNEDLDNFGDINNIDDNNTKERRNSFETNTTTTDFNSQANTAEMTLDNNNTLIMDSSLIDNTNNANNSTNNANTNNTKNKPNSSYITNINTIKRKLKYIPSNLKEGTDKEKEDKIQEYCEIILKRESDMKTNKEKDFNDIIIKITKQIEINYKSNKQECLNDQNTDIQMCLKNLNKEFWATTKLAKCPHCNAFGDKIKKQGYLKFFKMPLSQKKKKQMKTTKLNTNKDALEDGSGLAEEKANKKKQIKKEVKKQKEAEGIFQESSDSGDESDLEINNKGNNKSHNTYSSGVSEEDLKFLHPLEVQEQIKRLWNRDGDLLSLIFGNVFKSNKSGRFTFEIRSTGTELFFLENILVAPNRFRPENKSGGENSVYLHHQSTLLTRIINLADNMRMICSNLNNQDKDNKDSKDNKDNISVGNINNEVQSLVEKLIINSNTNNKTNNKTVNNNKDINKNFYTNKDIVSKWIELQETVNLLYDGQKASKQQDKESIGIRQILEKKKGIFRMKMMGKRVNYAGRSVISPDPMISAGEVGVPLYIAGKLTIPEEVTSFNKERLYKLICNGASKYPGANIVITETGQKILLKGLKDEMRIGKIAESLKESSNTNTSDNIIPNKFKPKTVYRHMQTGDILLVNRQPTLHKPSIMSHRAKILKGEKTIRLHYANCSSYNADFDGDEINIHLLQNHIARQEAYTISNTENQYIVPTSGKPIRGLIQDSIVSSVFVTMKNTFFTKDKFFQLVYSALEKPLSEGVISRIVIPEPTILKPKILFTGKQVITCLLKSLLTKHKIFNSNYSDSNTNGMNMSQGTKLMADIWTKSHILEGTVTIRNNELLTGILDKNHIGNVDFGVVHSYYELYGPFSAGELLSAFGRLFIYYLQSTHGFTCGVGDLILKDNFNLKRRKDIESILKEGMTGLAKYLEVTNFNISIDNYSNRAVKNTSKKILEDNILAIDPREQDELKKLVKLQDFKINEKLFSTKEELYNNHMEDDTIDEIDPIFEECKDNERNINNLKQKLHDVILENVSKVENNIDSVVKSAVNKISNKYTDNWVNHGLVKKFPLNYFSIMTLCGAKGSQVNHKMITCLLGQQESEGKRVPRMASGRTLPCFEPFDPNPRAGGYITDRFGTGIRPQEFFFHCMSGREGLIDTAVKTSRSGYLQRCLIKHLEQITVHYDHTVRDIDGNIIQFLFGEDSIDPMCTKYLSKFDYIRNNQESYLQKYKPEVIEENGININAVRYYTQKHNYIQDLFENSDNDPKSKNTFSHLLGIEKSFTTVQKKFEPRLFLGSISDNAFKKSLEYAISEDSKMSKKEKSMFKLAFNLKYFNSLITPGDNCGIVAAQSIGEQSTQMTLNTFHLAGSGGSNVTLGIPRLREILMTSENNIKTPCMKLPIFTNDHEEAKLLAKNFEKYFLIDVITHMNIERCVQVNNNTADRLFRIDIYLEELDNIEEYFGYDKNYVRYIFKKVFIPMLAKTLSRYYKQITKTNNKNSIIKLKASKNTEYDIKNTSSKKEGEEDYDKEDKEGGYNENDNEEGNNEGNNANDKSNKRKTSNSYEDHSEDDDAATDKDVEDDQEDDNNENINNNNNTEIDMNGLNGIENLDNIDMEDGEALADMENEGEGEPDEDNNKNRKDEKMTFYSYENITMHKIAFNSKKSKFRFFLSLPFTRKSILLKK